MRREKLDYNVRYDVNGIAVMLWIMHLALACA